ncbi:hypothetical protein DRJ48_01380 [Candidatus Woesearchaeota archaeon]|nr:hypothetical protein [Candidatus Woesearchaeota archaeon]RLE43261.1 MAG: hypothetical protein DRJ48_01380 [Candidatus Woesearchaeota archaeon]
MGKHSVEELYDIVSDLVKWASSSSVPYSQRLEEHLVGVACFRDKPRTLSLMEIIDKTTPEGAVGIDAGAGTGILGWSFLNAGGGYLYLVESMGVYRKFLERVAKELGFEDMVEVHIVNAAKFKPAKRLDYIVAELVITGLLNEPLVEVIKHLRQYANPECRFLPEKAVSKVELWGRVEHEGKQAIIPLSSDGVVYDEVEVRSIERDGVDTVVEFEVDTAGLPNKLVATTELIHPGGYKTGMFDTLCTPMTMYLDSVRGRRVREGDRVKVRINYKYGETKTWASLVE